MLVMEENKAIEKPAKGMTMSKIKFWGLMALAFFIGVMFMALGNEPIEEPSDDVLEATPTPQKSATLIPTKSEVGFQEIFDFSGKGKATSEPFKIQGEKFRLKYDCDRGLCQVYLYTKNGDLVGTVMNGPGPISDETIFEGSGEYYMQSGGNDIFFVIVEDYK